MGKKVYIEGEAHYFRPYFLDTGENLEDGDFKDKIMKTEGVYTARIKLNQESRDAAEDYLNGFGVPTDNMFGNLLTRDRETGDIFYKVVRGHMEPNFEDPLMGPPKVVDEEGKEWDPEVLIGNLSKLTIKLDVWKGNKATKIRWEGVRVDDLVPYEPTDEGGF